MISGRVPSAPSYPAQPEPRCVSASGFDPSRGETGAERCGAVVWKRDAYRRTGRTKGGFELHHTRCRCSRKATAEGLCHQHARMRAEGWNLSLYEDSH